MPLHKVPLCTIKYVGDVKSSAVLKYDTTANLNKTTNRVLHDKSIKEIDKISNLKYFYSNISSMEKGILNKNMYRIHSNSISLKTIKKLDRKTSINITQINTKTLRSLRLNSCFKFPVVKPLFRFYQQNLSKYNTEVFLLRNHNHLLDKLDNKKYVNFIRNLDLNILAPKKMALDNKINVIYKSNFKTIEKLKLRECYKLPYKFITIDKLNHCIKTNSSSVLLNKIQNQILSKNNYYNLYILNLKNLYKYNQAKNLTITRFNAMYKLFNKQLSTNKILYINKFNFKLFYKDNLKNINISLKKYLNKNVENSIIKHIGNIYLSSLFNREIFTLQHKYLKVNRFNLSIFKDNNLFLNNFNIKNISLYNQSYFKNDSTKSLSKHLNLFVNSLNLSSISKLNYEKYLSDINMKSITSFKNNKYLKIDNCKNICLSNNKFLNKSITKGLFKESIKYCNLNNIKNINKHNASYLSSCNYKKIFKSNFVFLNNVDLHRLSKLKFKLLYKPHVYNMYLSKFKLLKFHKMHNLFLNNPYYFYVANNKKIDIVNIEKFLNKNILHAIYKNKTRYVSKNNLIPIFNIEDKFLCKDSIFNINLPLDKYLEPITLKRINIKHNKYLDNATLLRIFKPKNLYLKDVSVIDIFKDKLKNLLDVSIVNIDKKHTKMLNAPDEKNIKLIEKDKFLELAKRWWWLDSTGPYDPIIIPNKDYIYGPDLLNNLKYEYLRFNTHPIAWGDSWGIDYNISPVKVSVGIMLDMVNIIGMISKHNVQGWLSVTGKEGIQLLMELLYDWYNMDSSEPNQDYYRIYRWIRWEAEKVYFLGCETGLKAIGTLLANLIDYVKYHHFDIVPLWRNLKAMDIERTFNKKPGNDDLIKDLDKLKGKRHYMIETKNINKKNIFGGLKNG